MSWDIRENHRTIASMVRKICLANIFCEWNFGQNLLFRELMHFFQSNPKKPNWFGDFIFFKIVLRICYVHVVFCEYLQQGTVYKLTRLWATCSHVGLDFYPTICPNDSDLQKYCDSPPTYKIAKKNWNQKKLSFMS